MTQTLIQQLVEKIEQADVYAVAKNTPLDYAKQLSTRLQNEVYLKREDLQQVFSFKLRGAFNRIKQLSVEEKARGVVCASAGNHAQGVALSGKELGLKTVIVMPVITPDIKINAVKSLGGTVVLHGENFDEANAHALSLAETEGLTYVHPFDNLDVIAGQGTIAKEVLVQATERFDQPIDAIFIAVGGGGLISGIGSYIKAHSPQTRIIGVEHNMAASMTEALKQQERISLDEVGTFADGAAVKQVGVNTFEIAKTIVDEMITVNTDETCAAIKDIFEENRTLQEPAGALAVAGMKKYLEENPQTGKYFIAINCGANINFDRLRHVAERAELGEKREALLAVTIPERPGSFRQFCKALGDRAITEFNYRYADNQDAEVFAGVKLKEGDVEKQTLIAGLESQEYPVLDLSDNEVAKVHLRFMVGGHAEGAVDEVLYRFLFPEKPGALLHFLTSMGDRWNISLFHYRNHGSDYGRVLVGIQVPPEERREFTEFLDKTGYSYWDETENPAYQRFLG